MMNIFLDSARKTAVTRMIPIWKRMGHKIVDNALAADVQLSSASIKTTRGIPTVIRIDGIYYDSATDYNTRNQNISKAHKTAQAVIYQSNLSKAMCQKYLAKRKTKKFAVIHNGINPQGWNHPIKHEGINVFCCAKWRRPKRLEETIIVFHEFLKTHPKAVLHVVGWFKKGGYKIPAKNVLYHDKITHEQMRLLYQVGDMFIHLCKKDSCPSAVVEAMAAGMPIITTNACGGATEMAKMGKGCIIVPGEVNSLEAAPIYTNAPNSMPTQVIKGLSSMMSIVANDKRRIVLPKQLHIESVAKKYIKVFKEIAK